MSNRTFGGFSDEIDTGIEKNAVVKNATQAVKQGGKSVIKGATRQVSQTANSFMKELLFGVSDPSGNTTNEDANNPQKTQNSAQTSKPTSDQAKLLETQQELRQMRNNEYGSQFSVESELQKHRAQRDRDEQERIQGNEQERIDKAQAVQSGMQDLAAPEGKKSGMQNPKRAKKAMLPVRRQQTKAETNQRAGG